MKPNLKIITSAAATAMLAWTTLAQESVQPTADQAALHLRMGEQRAELLKDTAQVTAILGLKVQNLQREKLGRVQDLLINLGTGRIREVILSTDKSLMAVPPQALRLVAGREGLQLDASPEKFAAAPRYDTTVADEVSESNHLVAVYDYFGEQSYFVTNPAALWTTNQEATPNGDGIQTTNDSNTIATRDPDGKETGNYYSNQNRVIGSWSSLGPVESARHLLGRPVRNLQDEKLGHVKNLIVDLSAGRVAGVIITSHGFLGIDAELSSAPVTAFHYDADRNLLQLDATPEQLSLSPAFNENAWQNFALPGYAAGKYYPYRIAPFNNSDAPYMTKGSGQVDEVLLARIRTTLQNDPRLSVNARNVQIITQNGLVTLRGPVNNNDEKQLVGQIVQQIATNEQVDNELEVQFTSAN